jgi:hypothetical protein
VDELGGWLQSFNAYRQGRGGDLQSWLSMYSAGPLLIDRKSSRPNLIHIPRAAVSVCGSIQPAIAKRLFTREFFEAGLIPRLLLAKPPEQPYRYTDAEIDPAAEAAFAAVVQALTQLQCETPSDGKPQPVTIPLAAAAKRDWVAFLARLAEEQAGAEDDLGALLNKSRGQAARLALLVHLVRVAAKDPKLNHQHSIDAASVRAGIAMATWFRREGERCYQILHEGQEAGETRRLVELIQQRGGRITVRELMQASRRYRGSVAEAETALHQLVQAGLGHWAHDDHDGQVGRPVAVFVLLVPGHGNTIPENAGKPELCYRYQPV